MCVYKQLLKSHHLLQSEHTSTTQPVVVSLETPTANIRLEPRLAKSVPMQLTAQAMVFIPVGSPIILQLAIQKSSCPKKPISAFAISTPSWRLAILCADVSAHFGSLHTSQLRL